MKIVLKRSLNLNIWSLNNTNSRRMYSVNYFGSRIHDKVKEFNK